MGSVFLGHPVYGADRHSIEITKNVPAIGLYRSKCKIEFIAVKIDKKNNLYYHEMKT